MLSRRTQIGLWTASLLTGLVGIVNLLSAVYPSFPDRVVMLKRFFPFEIRANAHLFSALIGFILLTLATNLLRRKRIAWLLTITLLIISIISHLIKGLDYEESMLSGLLLVQLLVMKNTFTAESDRPSITQGVRVFIGALLFTLAYGTAGFFILEGKYQVNFNIPEALWQTLAMFFSADNAGLQPKSKYGYFFANSVYIVGCVTVTYGLLMVLRPVLLRDTATNYQRQKAREIINSYGKTSLARLALLSDKSYYFSPSGRSVVAYVAKGRAAIALGSPIGPADDHQEAVIGFKYFCDRYDWYAAFYEVLPEDLDIYRNQGFRVLKIGEEAIIKLAKFSLKGKDKQNLRTAVNRFTKSGYYFQLYSPPIPEELFPELRLVSDDWLQSMNGSEKQFSIGWFHEVYLKECQIGVVYNSDNKIVAFATLLGNYNKSEVTVDLMRYTKDTPNGIMEYLFVSLIQHFQKLEYEGFNFSLSPLAGLGDRPESPRLEKVLRYLSQHLNQFYNFKGLHFFKEKFQPIWEPRYLVYPSLVSLSDVVVGLVRADSGDRLLDYIKPGS